MTFNIVIDNSFLLGTSILLAFAFAIYQVGRE